MKEGDLDEFVSRAQSALERSPSMDASATKLRVVLPFLKTLGWDVHGPDVVPEYSVDAPDGAVTVDFALRLDGTPVAFVVADGAGSDLTPEEGKRLAAAMRAGGVEWGMATNGHAYAFLTLDGGEARRSGCDLAALPENRAVVREFTRAAAVERREERARERRRSAVEDLAEDRPTLVDAVRTALLDASDDPGPVEPELATASEAFVDGVIAALDAGDHPATFAEGDLPGTDGDPAATDAAADPAGEGPATGSNDAATEPEGERPPTGSDEGTTREDEANSEDETTVTSDEETAGGSDAEASAGGRRESPGIVNRSNEGRSDSEFVVRFFNGRSSVGAVGHSTHAGAMAQAIEYMVEQRALDNRLDLPWGGADGRAIVNYEPVHPDGSEMDASTQLSNGYHVDTTVDVSVSRAVVEELAENSGLRVMFRGDWP